jgi:hypothetical protein
LIELRHIAGIVVDWFWHFPIIGKFSYPMLVCLKGEKKKLIRS